MIRKIIHIDEEKCNGCGLCAEACHEGAIDIVDGKAKLVRENFCDGFGDCLPNCPMGAITFEEREAPAYDEAAVKASQKLKEVVAKVSAMAQSGKGDGGSGSAGSDFVSASPVAGTAPAGQGCPGSRFMKLQREENVPAGPGAMPAANAGTAGTDRAADPAGNMAANFMAKPVSRLAQWPCQIKLLPAKAPFYDGAKLLIAADCTAYAYANMHEDFMKGKVTLIGCPKLDDIDYSVKLREIIAENDIKSVTVVRMEVPCCGGLQRMAEKALKESGKFIPWQIVTISRDGQILD